MADVFQDVDGAIRKLEPLLESLKNSVNELATSLIILDKSTKTVATSQSDLTTKTNAANTSVEKLSKTEKAELEIKRLATEEGKKEIDAQVRLAKAKKEVREEAQKNNGVIKQSGGLFKSMTKSILAAGAAMFGFNAALGVVKKVFGDAFKTIVGFEKAMSGVRAITGATDDEFKSLTESAKNLGSVTPKTASEVAELQTEFAKLGFSTAEILAATEATISLSIAAGADLAQSATVAASTVRGFGLSANETQRVVDVMAKSFSSSALDINKFQIAMATVAPTAKNAGFNIEQVTAMLGVLSNAGIDASTSGTALRNIMLDMAEGGFTLDQALQRINTGVSKNAEALKTFGKRGATVASVLADNIDKTNELTDILTTKAPGAAQKMADIMANNLAGDIDKAKSAWEGMILSFEDGSGFMAKIMRGAVQEVTNAIGDLTKMIKGVDAAIQEELVAGFTQFTDGLKEQIGVEETLSKAIEIRQGHLTKINDLEKALNIASGKRRRDIEDEIKQREKIVEAQTKVIKGIENEVKANEDAATAAIAALEEQERINTKLAEEEAQKRADARERIQIKAAKRRAEFLNKEGDKEVDDYIAKLKKENDAFEELLDERGEINIEGVRTQLTAEEEAIKASAERKLEIQKQLEEGKKDLIEGGIDAAEKIVTDRFNAGIDERLNSYLEANEAQQQILKDRLDKGQISEKQYEQQIKALKLKARQEEAKANKKKAQFENTIDTLGAVGKTFATLGYPAGIIPAAIVAGIGLANGIAIAAEPIPKFRKGVTGFEGGEAYVHSNELLRLSDGSMFKTPVGETRMYLPPQTDVIPAHKADPIIKEAEKSGLELQELKKINENLNKKQPQTNIMFTDRGFKVEVRKANSSTEYVDKYMRQV